MPPWQSEFEAEGAAQAVLAWVGQAHRAAGGAWKYPAPLQHGGAQVGAEHAAQVRSVFSPIQTRARRIRQAVLVEAKLGEDSLGAGPEGDATESIAPLATNRMGQSWVRRARRA